MERNAELEKMIIKFYKMMTECSIRDNGEANMMSAAMCLDRAGGDVITVKNHIRAWVKDHKGDGSPFAERFSECMEAFVPARTEPAPVAASPAMPQPSDSTVQYGMGLLEQAVVKLVSEMQADKIKNEVMGNIQNEVRSFISSEYGHIERKVVTYVDGKKAEVKGIQHEKFETILKFVANNEPVYLEGPAGSGKNVICKQVAEALGLKFYFTNAVTQEYKLTGFTDAMGNYQPTQFYHAFTKGGVFMLDEMDASIPEVLVILNAAIANRYFDFPAPIGYVEAHPDFRVIAAGNTTGHGADLEYVGRNQLDGASLDRFAFVKVDYSPAIEENVSGGNEELLNFCRQFRSGAKASGLNVIVSYRAIGRLAKMVNIMDDQEAIETCLVKGLEKDDINMIISNMQDTSKYFKALKKIVRSM